MPLGDILKGGGGGGAFAETAQDLIQKLVKGSVVGIGVLILCVVVLCLGLYIRYLRKFNIRVEIKSVRGSGSKGDPIYKIINDVGGFIDDKKQKTRWFRLRKEKVDLPSPPLEALQLDANGKNYIKILQKSDTEYYYLLPDKVEMTSVIRDGEELSVGQLTMKVADSDVVYWGQLRKKDNKKLFDTESLIMKFLPYIVPVLMFMLVIFMTYLITQHWGEFATAAQALKEAAQALEKTTTATVVVG